MNNKIKDSFDVRWLTAGKPYVILSTKDSLETPKVFIYQPNKVNYVVIHIGDSIYAHNKKKPITIVKKYASGIITSSLSETMDNQGLPYQLINDMSDIYAWTIDFFRLQKGDKFKIIYNERFIKFFGYNLELKVLMLHISNITMNHFMPLIIKQIV